MQLLHNVETHKDERGEIVCMLPNGVQSRSVLYITGKSGAVRGQHFHKHDTHYCYVAEGDILYSWIEDGEEKHIHLVKGDMIFTPTEEIHKFVFITDGVFIAMATDERTQENYEKDTIKHNF